jgi:hypothetical protein
VSRLLTTNPGKDIKIGSYEVNALVDTGSELTLMRADQYVKMGAPKLSQQIVEFRGIGSERCRTLGKFSTDVWIDGESYAMTIHIVSDTVMQRPLIIGTDFLETVELIVKRGNTTIRKIEEKNCNRLPEVQPDEVIDSSQSNFTNHSVVEKGNGSRHVPIKENSSSSECLSRVTSACLEDTVVMSKILADESVATNIAAVASGGDNTDGCDDIFVGCIEYRAKRRVEQTRPSVNSKERMKSENEASARKFEVVRRRATNPTPCRRSASNKKRKKATTSKTGDLQRDMVQREGEHEGPHQTSITADFMKPGIINAESDASETSDGEHI